MKGKMEQQRAEPDLELVPILRRRAAPVAPLSSVDSKCTEGFKCAGYMHVNI